MTLDLNKKLLIIAGLAIGFIFIVILLIASTSNKQGKENQTGKEITFVAQNGQYQDKICNLTFPYPNHWVISEIELPLAKEALSQAVFNQPAGNNQPTKNSILSYFCYSAQEYTAQQLLGEIFSGTTEQITFNNYEWHRNGNFIYTTINDKLIIFQMFFTKYDIKPKPGYEETFLEIIENVKVSNSY